MSTKNNPKLPRTPLIVCTVFLLGGFALTLAGLFIEIGVQWAFYGFIAVLVGAAIKVKYYRCPHCGAFRAVRKCTVNFTPFNCPVCRKKVDFEPSRRG